MTLQKYHISEISRFTNISFRRYFPLEKSFISKRWIFLFENVSILKEKKIFKIMVRWNEKCNNCKIFICFSANKTVESDNQCYHLELHRLIMDQARKSKRSDRRLPNLLHPRKFHFRWDAQSQRKFTTKSYHRIHS